MAKHAKSRKIQVFVLKFGPPSGGEGGGGYSESPLCTTGTLHMAMRQKKYDVIRNNQ